MQFLIKVAPLKSKFLRANRSKVITKDVSKNQNDKLVFKGEDFRGTNQVQ